MTSVKPFCASEDILVNRWVFFLKLLWHQCSVYTYSSKCQCLTFNVKCSPDSCSLDPCSHGPSSSPDRCSYAQCSGSIFPLSHVFLTHVPLVPCSLDPCSPDPCSLDPCSLDPCSIDPCSRDPSSPDPYFLVPCSWPMFYTPMVHVSLVDISLLHVFLHSHVPFHVPWSMLLVQVPLVHIYWSMSVPQAVHTSLVHAIIVHLSWLTFPSSLFSLIHMLLVHGSMHPCDSKVRIWCLQGISSYKLCLHGICSSIQFPSPRFPEPLVSPLCNIIIITISTVRRHQGLSAHRVISI